MSRAAKRYVYVMGCVGIQAVKIGLATDCTARLASLQTGCPLPLALLWSRLIPDAATVEKKLHSRFAGQHVRGEWFDLGPDAARIVREACGEIAPLGRPWPADIGPVPALTPSEIICRDAGRWFASLTELPGHVSVLELACHVRAFTDEEGANLWSRLSDRTMGSLIRKAYEGAPEGYGIEDDMIPVRTIGGAARHQELMAESDARLAPYYGKLPASAAARREAQRDEWTRQGLLPRTLAPVAP